jgi:hypothetical protein
LGQHIWIGNPYVPTAVKHQILEILLDNNIYIIRAM